MQPALGGLGQPLAVVRLQHPYDDPGHRRHLEEDASRSFETEEQHTPAGREDEEESPALVASLHPRDDSTAPACGRATG